MSEGTRFPGVYDVECCSVYATHVYPHPGTIRLVQYRALTNSPPLDAGDEGHLIQYAAAPCQDHPGFSPEIGLSRAA
jgi:hypothetical protein